MNILHVSNTDLAGGRFTGYYMLQELGKAHEVEMAVWKKTAQNSHVYLIPPENSVSRFFSTITMNFTDRMGLDGLTGTGGWILPRRDYFLRADVVHFHLIHNRTNLSIMSFPMLSRHKPIVWTIHDLWAMTGGCEHSFECDRWLTGCTPRCPHPRRRSLFKRYTPFLQWKIKNWIYQHTDMTLIVASKWMKDKIEKSPLLGHFKCHLIPFGINLDVFKNRSKTECRKKLGIELDCKVIAFRDVGLKHDRFKGMHWIMEALTIYQPKKPTCLVIFENGRGFKVLSPKYNIVTPGWIDSDDLATYLSAADIFLMPSIQEAFGLMAVEAMACSTPVLVFEGTSLPDVIKSPFGGIAVPARDSEALANEIEKLLENDDLTYKLGKHARMIAEREYGFPLYAQRHLNLYKEAIERHRNGARGS